MQKPINPSTSRTAPATIIQSSGYSIAESKLIRSTLLLRASQRPEQHRLSTIAIRAAGSRSAGFPLVAKLVKRNFENTQSTRTAVTARLSFSAMIVTVFPASAISRSCFSSSGSHGRLASFLAQDHFATRNPYPSRSRLTAATTSRRSSRHSSMVMVVSGFR
jgi:hypothetical protein